MKRASRSPPLLGYLGRRIFAAFLVVALLPLGLTALISHWRSRSAIESILADNAGKTAHAFASDLDVFVERKRVLLRAVAASASDSESVLSWERSPDPDLVALMRVDEVGEVLAWSRRSPGLDQWAADACRELLGDRREAIRLAGEGLEHEIIVAVPNTRGGGLCGQISFTLHQDMMSERAKSELGGSAYIVNQEGKIVCHAFEEHEPHQDRGEALVGPGRDVAMGGEPWQGTTPGQHGVDFAAFAPSNSVPLGVWVTIPAERAAAPLRTWLTRSLLYAGLVSLAVVLAAVVMVRSIVAPIRDVANAAGAVADGRLGETVKVEGDDEVAALAREFNRMSHALAESYARLDERVALRTRELQAAREFSDLLLDTMRERILVIDDGFRIVRANNAALSAWGSDIVGQICYEIHRAAGGSAEHCPARRVLESGVPESEERVYQTAAGPEILAVDTFPLGRTAGGVEAVVEIGRDITEITQMQAQLIHQEKMATLGTLAAGLAHEIGNPLASLSSELELLELHWEADAARGSLPILRDQIRRISELLRELVDLGRQTGGNLGSVSPRDLISDVARLLNHDPRKRNVSIETYVGEDVSDMWSNRDRLLQILLNLGLNALEALNGEGWVKLSARADGLRGVRLTVSDNGPGVPEEVAGRIFAPFFTTRKLGLGSGLGLFVSERIARDLGGRIEFISRGGAGATFVVVLPGGHGEGAMELGA